MALYKSYYRWFKVPANLVSISREVEKVYEFGQVCHAIPSKPDIKVKGHDNWFIDKVNFKMPFAYVSVWTEYEDKEAEWFIEDRF